MAMKGDTVVQMEDWKSNARPDRNELFRSACKKHFHGWDSARRMI